MTTENFTIHPKDDPIAFTVLDGDTVKARINLSPEGAGRYELYDAAAPDKVEQRFQTNLKQDELNEYLLEQTKQHYERKAEIRKMNPKELYRDTTAQDEYGY